MLATAKKKGSRVWLRGAAIAMVGSGLALAAACSSAGAPTMASPDAGTIADSAPAVDTGVGSTDAGVTGPTPTVLALPADAHARLFGVTYTPDGSILAVGAAGGTAANADHALLLVKLTSKGQLDTTFGGKGYVTKNVSTGAAGEVFRGIVVQTQGANAGKIVVAGAAEHDQTNPAATTRDVVVVRFKADGSIDDGFGTAGVARFPLGDGVNVQQWGLAKYADDDLLVTGARLPAGAGADAGTINELVAFRLKGADGALATFGQGGVFSLGLPQRLSPRTATILADNSAVLASYSNPGSGNRPILAKITGAGAADPAFGTAGVYYPETEVPGFPAGHSVEAYGADLQGDKFVTSGYGKESSANTVDGWVSIRVTGDGKLDSTYGTSGHVFFLVNGQPAASRAVAVLPDQRVMMLGGASPPKPASDPATQAQHAAIAILEPNGAFDPSFSKAGPKLYDLGGPATGRAAHFFWAAAISPDKKTVAVVGVKGGVLADAGVSAGADQAAVLLLPAVK